MDAQPTQVAVLFELSVASAAEVRVHHGVAQRSFMSASSTFHEVVASGLQADTQYDYEVWVNGQRLAAAKLTTAPESAGPVRFIVYGDSRSNEAKHRALVREIETRAPDFILSTGDVVAHGGDLADWQTFFDSTRSLLASVPFFPVLGNHELMPRRGGGLANYQHFFRAPTAVLSHHESPALSAVALEANYAFRYGSLYFIAVNSLDRLEPGAALRTWLESKLDEARSLHGIDHVFVAMHHGLFSSGAHGENEELFRDGIDELFRQRHVSVVFSGHDHLYERGESHGLKYVLSGGGGAPLYPRNYRKPYQLAFVPEHHFVLVEVNGARVQVQAIGADGSVLDKCGFRGNRSWRCPTARAQASNGPIYLALNSPVALGLIGLAALAGALWMRRKRSPTM